METFAIVVFSLSMIISAMNIAVSIVMKNKEWTGWMSAFLGWLSALLLFLGRG